MKLSFCHHLLITALAAFCVQSAGPAWAAIKSWTGATSHAWATTSNWSTGSEPTSADNVYINTTTNAPQITVVGERANYLYVGNTATGALTISSGGTVESTGFSFLGYNLSGNGTATVTGAGRAID